MKKLFIEAPCWGFGPISTSLAIAKKLETEYEIIFVTYGEALNYLKECKAYKYLEIDTRVEKEFPELQKRITMDDYVIANTNIELSCFLLERGYRVLVIDTLYWMWNQVPQEYVQNKNIITQVYYGRGIGKLELKEECKPIIDYNVWTAQKVDDNNCALISLGGMSEPVELGFIITNAKKIIDKIVANLPDKVNTVYVLGGLLQKDTYVANQKHIEILGTVSNVKHRELVEKCKYLFFSPGLTSLYELLASDRLMCLLPGLCVSQVYQNNDFHHYFEYPYCIMWKEHNDLIKYFSSVSELEGLAYMRNYLLNKASLENIDMANIIHEYINAVDNNLDVVKKEKLDKIFNLKSVDELVPLYLEQM